MDAPDFGAAVMARSGRPFPVGLLIDPRHIGLRENLNVIIRPAAAADAVAIASILNALISTTTIEWTAHRTRPTTSWSG